MQERPARTALMALSYLTALLALTLFVIALFASACALPREQKAFLGITVIPVNTPISTNSSASGSPPVSPASRSTARTTLPSVSLEVVSVTIRGSGPAGASFGTSIPVTEGSPVSAGGVEVDAGTWMITAEGYNAGSEKVAEGSSSAFLLPGESGTVELILYPVRGNGTLEIITDWPAGLPAETVLTGSLSPLRCQESYTDLQISLPYGSGPATFENIPAGYHTLVLSLSVEGTALAGMADVVRIAAGVVTTASIGFTLSTSRAGISISLDMADPLQPEMELPFLPYPRGFPVRLSTSGGAEGDGDGGGADGGAEEDGENGTGGTGGGTLPADASFRWYVNGSAAGEGTEISVRTEGLALENRVDLFVISESAGSAGSTTAALSLFDPPALGPYRLFRSCIDGTDDIDGLSGARGAAVAAGAAPTAAAPGGDLVIACGYDENELSAFSLDSTGRDVSFLAMTRNGFDGPLDRPVSVTFSPAAVPGGRFLYAACPGSGSIQVFSIDDGSLMPSAAVASVEGQFSLAGVVSCAMTPDGRFLYAAAAGADSVVSFSLDQGIPSFLAVVNASGPLETILGAPLGTAVSPDSAFLYVTAQGGDSLLCFSIDPNTGALTLHAAFTDGVGGVTGLNGAEGIAVSPDGKSIYVAGYYDNGFSHFGWDEAFTVLSFSEEYREGSGGITGLAGCRDVAVSPDGGLVAAASSGSDTILLFSRNASTGVLSLTGSVWAGEANPVLNNPRYVSFTPDGSALICACSGSDELAVFLLP